MNEEFEQHFVDLPNALIEEMLSESTRIGGKLSASYEEIKQRKDKIRALLQNKKSISNESMYPSDREPTTCGVDGASVIERLLGTDFIACAALAIEGLVPPYESERWEAPQHKLFIDTISHNSANSRVIGGLMMMMELELAAKAPHDIVFLDGSFTSPLIAANQTLNQLSNLSEGSLKDALISDLRPFLESYLTILTNTRRDKMWVSLPKYTSRRELGALYNWPSAYDDRAILTTVLKPGEFTHPISLQKPPEPWHMRLPPEYAHFEAEIVAAIDQLYVMYYRPSFSAPALRVEIPLATAKNASRIALLLSGLKAQCCAPGVYEPYPLYLADRMVKNLSKAVSAIRHSSARHMAEVHEDANIEDIVFLTHGYRTEQRGD